MDADHPENGVLIPCRLTVVCEADICQVVGTAVDGSVWVASYNPGKSPDWMKLHQPGGFRTSPDSRPGWAVPDSGHLDLFAVGLDGKVYTNPWNMSAGWNVRRTIPEIEQEFEALQQSPAIVHRVNRQVELFVQSKDGEIFRTWCS